VAELEDLLRKRKEVLEDIDRKIATYAKPVTLLFTDIVGSTEFFETAGDIAGRQMIQTHNDLLFPIIEAYGGNVIKTIGDSIMASFADPGQAVQCCMRMQEALQNHNSRCQEQERIRVRMGLHFGQAVMDERDLFGDMVNTAARVEATANGEEILISGELKEQLSAAGTPLVFLGSETVKGKKRKIDFYLVNWNNREEEALLASWKERHGPVSATARPEAIDGAPAVHKQRVILKGNLDLRKAAKEQGEPKQKGNPYLNRVMIPHPSMFFGRNAVVKRVGSRICAQRPQSISIVGERRIGKSSLLNYLYNPRTRLKVMEEAERYICLFIDFQQLRTIEEGQFLQLIYGELKKTLKDQIELELSPDNEGMRLLCEQVTQADYKLVMLFDEFESVTKNERIGAQFYSFLRSLANNFSVAFITASGRNLKDMCVSHEISDSPFFNVFSVQHLGLFRRSAAETLISEPSAAAGIALEPVSSQILACGGLYPFFLQMACSAWFEFLESENLQAEEFRGGKTPREVLGIFREEAEPHFEYVLETLPKEEIEALTAVLAGKNPDSDAAEALERKGYLQSAEEGGFQPFSQEFQRFATRIWNLD
jgi:class 3 adenylate cyclase